MPNGDREEADASWCCFFCGLFLRRCETDFSLRCKYVESDLIVLGGPTVTYMAEGRVSLSVVVLLPFFFFLSLILFVCFLPPAKDCVSAHRTENSTIINELCAELLGVLLRCYACSHRTRWKRIRIF